MFLYIATLLLLQVHTTESAEVSFGNRTVWIDWYDNIKYPLSSYPESSQRKPTFTMHEAKAFCENEMSAQLFLPRSMEEMDVVFRAAQKADFNQTKEKNCGYYIDLHLWQPAWKQGVTPKPVPPQKKLWKTVSGWDGFDRRTIWVGMSNGSAVNGSYANWGRENPKYGQPDDLNTDTSDTCVMVSVGLENAWFDIPCKDAASLIRSNCGLYACEKEGSFPTTTTTTTVASTSNTTTAASTSNTTTAASTSNTTTTTAASTSNTTTTTTTTQTQEATTQTAQVVTSSAIMCLSIMVACV